MKQTILLISLILFVSSCNSKKNNDPELYHLAGFLTGTFSSKEQSEKESGYTHMNLINTPIWEEKSGYWLYSELHNGKDSSAIYHQRIIHLERLDKTTLKSTSYSIPNPENYANGWNKKSVFKHLTEDNLEIKEGCALHFYKKTSSIYVGRTNNQLCTSSIENVAFIMTNMVISTNKISLWNRGYNLEGKQVWGKIKGSYKFKRVQE